MKRTERRRLDYGKEPKREKNKCDDVRGMEGVKTAVDEVMTIPMQ